jgi:hypothetical protein
VYYHAECYSKEKALRDEEKKRQEVLLEKEKAVWEQEREISQLWSQLEKAEELAWKLEEEESFLHEVSAIGINDLVCDPEV